MRRVRPDGPARAFLRLAWCLSLLLGLVAGIAPAQARAGRSADAATPKPKSSEGEDRRWIKHKVIPYERLDDIAERYGVSRAAIVRWNKSLQKKQWIYAGQTLRIHARRFPPPREKITYEVQFGDSWQEIADRFNVRQDDLRKWNKKVPRRFRAGAKLTVYTNPLEPEPVPGEEAELEGGESTLPTFSIRKGGLSVGKPNRGRLVNGVRLPDSDLYTIRDEDKAWGSSHTVEVLMTAIARFRQGAGYDGELVIGAISRQGGGRFRPHRSHQSGRDIDIRLPRKPGASRKDHSPSAIDWRMSWKLIESFVESGEVEYIFLDWSRQRLLYKAALASGASKEQLSKVLQYPRKPKTNNGLVRHAKGHTVHIHVRVACAKGNGRCVSY